MGGKARKYRYVEEEWEDWPLPVAAIPVNLRPLEVISAKAVSEAYM
jgi:hypothetical protein